jgi:type IV pilus assembly protein PilY1
LPGSDTKKSFFLNYDNPYPAGTTPFTNSYIGNTLFLHDRNDKVIFEGMITGVTYYGGDTSGTSEIALSGTTNTPEYETGASPYNYDLFWRVVTAVATSESEGTAGSDYLDDLSLYARTTDLRDDLDGTQNIVLYTVYAFGGDVAARVLLRDAAKNGGFVDKNDSNTPDLVEEWDRDGDGDPDTFFEASGGFLLEQMLTRAIADILKRSASGTAVSVLAASGEGEGNLIQAYYRPAATSGVTENIFTNAVTEVWAGYLQSVWVDDFGNLREDTDGNLALDESVDKVMVYFLDSDDANGKIKRFDVSGTNPFPDLESAPFEVVELEGISPLWEAGSVLAQKSADGRKIFTCIDKDKDENVDETTYDAFDDIDEVVSFHANTVTGVSNVMPYLGVRDDATWGYLGFSHRDRAHNLIEYIRGKETGFSGTTNMLLRSRVIGDQVWKLGDIVFSSPVSVSRPPDNYHIIYGDESYQAYFDAYKDRETVVYVGANDGMLHAFTSWKFDRTNLRYSRPASAPGDEDIGDEIWAYIPQALLPHLKWLPSPDYGHVYYVDHRPKVFDAKIFSDDPKHPNGWGTVLLIGLNFGGKQICSEDYYDDGTGVTVFETRTFSPSYTAIDVTDPRAPVLLWERAYEGLGFTTSVPGAIKVKDKWFAVFGSGPTDYDGTSNQEAHVFVVDLATGEAHHDGTVFASGTTGWLYTVTKGVTGFMNSPVVLDKELNFNVDGVYFGETYWDNTTGTWKGKAHKLTIPCTECNFLSAETPVVYVDNPNDGSNPWTLSTLFESPGPITAPMSLATDFFDNVYIYFGTGRYIWHDDKTNTDTQHLFAVADPFFNSLLDTSPNDFYVNYSKSRTLTIGNLFHADPYMITTDGSVFNDGSGLSRITNFDGLLDVVRNTEDQSTFPDFFEGWSRTLTTSGERAVTKFSVLGGIVFAPTFVPNEDICGFGGDTSLFGLYFETGTAFFNPVLPGETEATTVDGEEHGKVLGKISLGTGKASALRIHAGQEEGAKAFVQQTTGIISEAELNPALKIKSGLINWREK